jgi:hypothetical protein
MANTRSRLLMLLSNAERALAESESLMAELSKASPESREAQTQLMVLRDSIARIEKLLNAPKRG